MDVDDLWHSVAGFGRQGYTKDKSMLIGGFCMISVPELVELDLVGWLMLMSVGLGGGFGPWRC